jgi:predicted small secreted protein
VTQEEFGAVDGRQMKKSTLGRGMDVSDQRRERGKMVLIAAMLGAAVLILSGCETLRGAGRDLQAAGDRVSSIVNKVNFLW